MDSVATYRGFDIRMRIVEQATYWTCAVAFEREDGAPDKKNPSGFQQTVSKVATGAINLGTDMLRRAEARIDNWYETGND